MPDGSRVAINMLKLLMFYHPLAATHLAAANLATRQHQLSLFTMFLGPVGLRRKIVTRCDAPQSQIADEQLKTALKVNCIGSLCGQGSQQLIADLAAAGASNSRPYKR